MLCASEYKTTIHHLGCVHNWSKIKKNDYTTYSIPNGRAQTHCQLDIKSIITKIDKKFKKILSDIMVKLNLIITVKYVIVSYLNSNIIEFQSLTAHPKAAGQSRHSKQYTSMLIPYL